MKRWLMFVGLVLLTLAPLNSNLVIGDWTAYVVPTGQSSCEKLRVVGLVRNTGSFPIRLSPAVHVTVKAEGQKQYAEGHVFLPSLDAGQETCWVASLTQCPTWPETYLVEVLPGSGSAALAVRAKNDVQIVQSPVVVERYDGWTVAWGKLYNAGDDEAVIGSIVSTLYTTDGRLSDCAETGLPWPYWMGPNTTRRYQVWHRRAGDVARVQVEVLPR